MYPYPQQPQQQQWRPLPPKPSGLGCMLPILLALGAVLLGVVALAIFTHRSPAEREAERQETARLMASAAASAAEANAQNEARYRKACKLSAKDDVYIVADDDVIDRCHDMIRASLKVPGSGDFPGAREDTRGFLSDDGCHRTYTSFVVAQNVFGVKVRNRYSCTFDPRTGLYSTKNL